MADNPTANAMALPGGNIVVYTGLLDRVASENELAFVLAHELGHYAHRDHLRGMGRALVFAVIAGLLFGPDSGTGSLLAGALGLTELSFSRRQETRADAFAVAALHCAYGHVGGSTDFFDRIGQGARPRRVRALLFLPPGKRAAHRRHPGVRKGQGLWDSGHPPPARTTADRGGLPMTHPGTRNLFEGIPDRLPDEFIERLGGSQAVTIERIVSRGHCSPEGFWYDQARDEHVFVVKGRAGLQFEDATGVVELGPGDHLCIPARARHRVAWTSTREDTVWLTVHYP